MTSTVPSLNSVATKPSSLFTTKLNFAFSVLWEHVDTRYNFDFLKKYLRNTPDKLLRRHFLEELAVEVDLSQFRAYALIG